MGHLGQLVLQPRYLRLCCLLPLGRLSAQQPQLLAGVLVAPPLLLECLRTRWCHITEPPSLVAGLQGIPQPALSIVALRLHPCVLCLHLCQLCVRLCTQLLDLGLAL